MKKQTQLMREKIAAPVLQLAVLSVLCALAFRPELSAMVSVAMDSSESVHLLTVPMLAGLMIYLRRDALRRDMTNGSAAGVLMIIFGFLVYALATWPFNYGYARDITIIPILGGIILSMYGWGVFRLSLPILLLMLAAIPIPSRIYAAIIIKLETHTIEAAARILSMLPSTDVSVKGVDIIFSSAKGAGVVALGESNRGARLLLAFGVLGIFIVFSEIRLWRRVLITAVLAVTIVLLCNFLRLLFCAILEIYTPLSSGSGVPRAVSFILSIFVLYGLFVLVSDFKLNLFVEDKAAGPTSRPSASHDDGR